MLTMDLHIVGNCNGRCYLQFQFQANMDGGGVAVGAGGDTGVVREIPQPPVVVPAPQPFTKSPPRPSSMLPSRPFTGRPLPRLAGPPPGWVRSLPPWDIFTERSSNCI